MRNVLACLLAIPCPLLLAAETVAPRVDEVLIAPRRDDVKRWFQSSLSPEAYQREAVEAARLLGGEGLDADTKNLLAEAVKREPERTGKAFAACLGNREARARLGALRGIELANPPPHSTGKALAACVLGEGVPQVRDAALALIRARKDAAVAAEVVRFWRDSFDSDLGFDEAKRGAAVAAMRDIGDRRTFQALLYYATVEVYAGTATSPTVETANITGAGINLPIELPGTSAISVRATIIVPAISSLKQATGQDFGKNIARWRAWVGQQPEFKK